MDRKLPTIIRISDTIFEMYVLKKKSLSAVFFLGEQESAKEGGNTDIEEILDNDDSGLGAMAKNCNPSSKTESLVTPMEGPTVSPKNAKKIRKYQLFLEVK